MCWDYPDWESHEGRKRGKRCLAWWCCNSQVLQTQPMRQQNCWAVMSLRWYTYISRWWFQPLVKFSNLTLRHIFHQLDIHISWVGREPLGAWLSHMIWAESSSPSRPRLKHCKLARWISTGSPFIKYVEWTVIGEVNYTCWYNLTRYTMKTYENDNFWSQKSITRAVSLQIGCLFQELVQVNTTFFPESRIDVLVVGANHYHFCFCVVVLKTCFFCCLLKTAWQGAPCNMCDIFSLAGILWFSSVFWYAVKNGFCPKTLHQLTN